jgi:hypothetical protein
MHNIKHTAKAIEKMKRTKKETAFIEIEFCNAEKKNLIRGLYKDDPERYYPSRLARIFLLSRERINQILNDV